MGWAVVGERMKKRSARERVRSYTSSQIDAFSARRGALCEFFGTIMDVQTLMLKDAI